MGLLSVLGLQPRAVKPGVAPTADAAAPGAGVDAGGSGAAVDKNLAAFQKVRDALQKAVDALVAHPQQAKIATPIADAKAKLAEADGHAASKDWKAATASLTEVKNIAAAAKKLADEWANYAKQRAITVNLILAYKTHDTSVDAAMGIVTGTADAAANQTPPDFATALKTLKALDAKRKPQIADLVKDVKTRLAKVEQENKKVKGFLDPALTDARPLVKQAEDALSADNPALARQAAIAALRLLGPAERRSGRRAEFDAQRAATVKAIDAVRAAAAVADRAKALDDDVTKADALAAADTLKIESGVKLLAETKQRAERFAGLAKTIGGYATESKAAEAELAALDTHAAAAKVAPQREAVRKLLADAKTQAEQADAAADPVAAWTAALTGAQRAKADVAVARKLADGMGVAAAAEAAAGKPDDAEGLKAALQKLRADAQAARKTADAKAAADEFKRVDEQVAAADKALADKDGAAAAAALGEAAKALAAAKTIQAEHGQFQSRLAGVEAELKSLQKSPRAAQIKARIDPVEQNLKAAKDADQAHKGQEAIVALRAAKDAVAAAREADEQRKAYDARAAAAAKRVKATKDAAAKAALETELADAEKLADALDFDAAQKAVQQVEVKLDQARLDGLMKAAKPDPKAIADLAKAMTTNGGATTVDAMIQAVPDGGNADLIAAMASGRYGVKFTAGKALDAGGDPAKAMKVCCEMWSRIPQDIVKNKSISGISYEDMDGGISAGHSFATAAITMKGRAGAVNQEFGANLTEEDPNNPGTFVDQLPAVDEECKPENDTAVDFLNFAAAHEVGHAVDESRGFMRKNGSGAAYGGWVTFGGNLQPLADAIGATARFADFYKTAEQKQYVMDRLQSRDPSPPAVTAGSAEDIAKQKFDQWHTMATSQEIFRRNGDSQSLKLNDGKIYHEAYARVWVGYDAAARSKGLTGYQFRAPGEWFAELYAGFRSGKLKATHPAMTWLKDL